MSLYLSSAEFMILQHQISLSTTPEAPSSTLSHLIMSVLCMFAPLLYRPPSA